MSEQQHNGQSDEGAQPVPKKKTSTNSKKPLIIITIVFIVFVLFVFLRQKTDSLDWAADYETALATAKQENKPLFIFMFEDRYFGRFTKPFFESTFKNPTVTDFIEQNLVPVMIDVNVEKDVPQKYNYTLDPTIVVVTPDGQKTVETYVGHGRMEFMKWVKQGLEKVKGESE